MQKAVPPEVIGIVHVEVVAPPGHDEESMTLDVMLKAGPLLGMVTFAFPVGAGLVTVHLNTKQAYHLAAALQRSRAAVLRSLS